jgi:hypothetical protein
MNPIYFLVGGLDLYCAGYGQSRWVTMRRGAAVYEPGQAV